MLKGRGRAVPAEGDMPQGTRRPVAEGGRDGPRQRVITSTVTTTMSAHRGKADIPPQGREVRFWPILLQKSFWDVDGKIFGPLIRFTRGDVRDHIVSSKIGHGPL